jgi:predicted nucleotidyltransferase component of viral defense system
MQRFAEQEIFEVEILEWLKNKGFLRKLIFGGGTMLRLCHGLNRFSLDLDFWTFRVENYNEYYKALNLKLSGEFEITDSGNKFNTMLFEVRRSGK